MSGSEILKPVKVPAGNLLSLNSYKKFTDGCAQEPGEQDTQDEVGNQARGGLPRIFVDDLPAFQVSLQMNGNTQISSHNIRKSFCRLEK